jgi:hypothetical protein
MNAGKYSQGIIGGSKIILKYAGKDATFVCPNIFCGPRITNLYQSGVRAYPSAGCDYYELTTREAVSLTFSL